MSERILRTIRRILQNEEVKKAISKDITINSCDEWEVRQYIDFKIEQLELKSRLEYVDSMLRTKEE